MRLLIPAALLFVLAACEMVEEKDTRDSGDTPGDTPTTTSGSVDGDADGDGFAEPDDCDDADPSVYPEATELCDGLDNDCDEEVDDGLLGTWYADADGDTFGDPAVSAEACEPGSGLVADNTDCNDLSAEIYPGATEIFDELDNDCDLVVDDLPEWHHQPSEGDVVGPEDWATYWPECGGSAQSPIEIDLDTLLVGGTPTITTSYVPTTLQVENNGHTIEFVYGAGSSLVMDGVTYQLKQFHFHAAAEHTIYGYGADPMEMHVVHKNDAGTATVFDDTYVVLATWIYPDPYAENLAFEALGWDQVATLLSEGMSLEDAAVEVDIRELLPVGWQALGMPGIHYDGSLTTPPCLEAVHFLVADDYVFLSPDQLSVYTTLYPDNARDTQDVNGREMRLDF